MPYNPETGEWISDDELFNLEYGFQWNPTGGPGGQGASEWMPTGADHGFETDFDPDLSAQEIANMSGEDLDQLLRMYDLDPDKYSKYFAKFDQSQIENIQKTLQNKLSSLSLQGRNIVTKAQGEIGGLTQQQRTLAGQRGFEVSGDLTSAFGAQQDSLLGGIQAGQRAVGLERESAELGAEEATRSAFEDYESKFQSALGGVEAQIDADEAAADSGGGCCFIVLEVENNNELDRNVRQYRDEQLNDLNRAGYYKLAQVVVPLMRKSKLMKWFFKYSFVKPAKSWAKWYYNKKGMGWIFEPLRRFWLGMFTYLGKEHKLRTEI
jgi:hypothetical protein